MYIRLRVVSHRRQRIFVSSWIGTLTHLAHKLPEEKQEQKKDPPDRMMLMTFRDDQKVRQNT